LTEDGTYPEGTVNHAMPNRLRDLAMNLARWWSSRTCSAPAERETSFATPEENSHRIKLKEFGKQGKESEESEGK
jgi:hypothetical protein